MALLQRLSAFIHPGDWRVSSWLRAPAPLAHRCFQVLWFVTLALAILGPLAGLRLRLNSPPELSQLILGSRAGVFVSPRDLTVVRFTVGPLPKRLGIVPGDKILAVYGQPMPEIMPLDERAWQGDDPAYILMGDLLWGTDSSTVPLTIRHESGRVDDVVVKPGENYANDAAKELGISPHILGQIDLVEVLFYPLLVWIAFSIYSRNRRQIIPIFLSSSILLFLIAQQPSATFLISSGMSARILFVLYDLSDILLLASLMLFPSGRPGSKFVLLAISSLPVLLFLHGDIHRLFLAGSTVLALGVFVHRLHSATDVTKRQLKFLLAGVAAYPALQILSVALDAWKYHALSLTQYLLLEMAPGIADGLATLSLFLVLFAALRRHRLYDADALFPRSVMLTALTLTITVVFAGLSTSLKSAADALGGHDAGHWPALIAAAGAVLLINPAQSRIQRRTQQFLQRGLFVIRTELPKRVDDLRETASPKELLQVILRHIAQEMGASSAAGIVDGRVVTSIGVREKDVRQWLRTTPLPEPRLSCNREDRFLPLRLPLLTAAAPRALVGWIVLGPRPDGSVFSLEERRALLEVGECISRAVDVALQRQQARSTEERWKRRQESRMQAMEARLESLTVAVLNRKQVQA